MSARLRVGTCSWKYPSWEGLVYSTASGIDQLAEYAAVTPEDFRFTIKCPNALTLTHFRPRKGETALRPNPQFLSAPLFQDVLSRLQPLARWPSPWT